MVMVTIDIPKQINKEIEHFKIEHELKDKREAINLLLRQCVANTQRKMNTKKIDHFKDLYREIDKLKSHNLTPEQIEAMDSDVYD